MALPPNSQIMPSQMSQPKHPIKNIKKRKGLGGIESSVLGGGGGIIDRDRCGHGLWAKVIQTVTGRQGSRPPLYKLYFYKYTNTQIYKYVWG